MCFNLNIEYAVWLAHTLVNTGVLLCIVLLIPPPPAPLPLPPGVAPDAPLMDAGLDSLGAVELRSSLESKLQVQLPATVVFDYPSITDLTRYVTSVLPAPAAAAAASATSAAGPRAPMPLRAAPAAAGGSPLQQQLVLVAATAERMPSSRHAAASSQAPAAGGLLVDSIQVVPLERWDVELALTGDMPARFGGFIARPADFDVAPFAMAESEAVMVDPQQRLLLEATAQLVAAAPRGALAAAAAAEGSWTVNTGVFVGFSTPDYADLKKVATPIGVYSATGESCHEVIVHAGSRVHVQQSAVHTC